MFTINWTILVTLSVYSKLYTIKMGNLILYWIYISCISCIIRRKCIIIDCWISWVRCTIRCICSICWSSCRIGQIGWISLIGWIWCDISAISIIGSCIGHNTRISDSNKHTQAWTYIQTVSTLTIQTSISTHTWIIFSDIIIIYNIPIYIISPYPKISTHTSSQTILS